MPAEGEPPELLAGLRVPCSEHRKFTSHDPGIQKMVTTGHAARAERRFKGILWHHDSDVSVSSDQGTILYMHARLQNNLLPLLHQTPLS